MYDCLGVSEFKVLECRGFSGWQCFRAFPFRVLELRGLGVSGFRALGG